MNCTSQNSGPHAKNPSGAGQPSASATSTPFFAASHELPYTSPSHPHTGAYRGSQPTGRGSHAPTSCGSSPQLFSVHAQSWSSAQSHAPPPAVVEPPVAPIVGSVDGPVVTSVDATVELAEPESVAAPPLVSAPVESDALAPSVSPIFSPHAAICNEPNTQARVQQRRKLMPGNLAARAGRRRPPGRHSLTTRAPRTTATSLSRSAGLAAICYNAPARMTAAPPIPADLRLGEPLGSGAVATVVRVHAGDGRVFAGKILHASHRGDAAAVQRFAQEAALLQGLRDPNIVELFGVADVAGERVLLLELVDGPTLAQLIAREAPLGEARLAALGAGIARGLARAHAAGLVHRDLKPANILVAGGHTPKIGDFGMARATSLAGVDRTALAVLGTPDYMAPECLDPLAVDVRSDLYALGCILHEMATGRPPFAGATAFGVIEAHRRAPAPVLPDSFSPPLRALVHSLLAKNPGDRPQAAAQVAALLEQLAAGQTAALAVPAGDRGDGPSCAGCGQPRVEGLAVCLGCGLRSAQVEPGPYTVLVTGPGEPGDQLDVALRERLRRYVAGNPGLGVVPGSLAEKLPRVPFTFLTRVSEASARLVCDSLVQLGLEGEAIRGSAIRSPRMRKKARALAGRASLITLGSMVGLYSNGRILFVLPVILALVAGVTSWRSLRQLTAPADRTPPALPPPLAKALADVERVAPTIDTARHRHSLRAVVRRALALAPALGPGGPADELGQAVSAAAAAAARLDALDRALAARDIQREGETLRATLHERDTWSARLLSLTAALDAFEARLARAGSRTAADDAALADLRARVEALEEVQRGAPGAPGT